MTPDAQYHLYTARELLNNAQTYRRIGMEALRSLYVTMARGHIERARGELARTATSRKTYGH